MKNVCRGKQRYASRDQARKVLDVLRSRRRRGHSGQRYATLKVYECPACGGYHLGNPHLLQ